MNNNIVQFVKRFDECKTEDLRYYLGFDYEISDKIKKKILFNKNIKFHKENRIFTLKELELIKTKSDLIFLIKNSNEGIAIYNLVNSYPLFKNDLIDLVKYKEKDRILIIIKGKTCLNLNLFAYNNTNYVSVSNENLISWHKIYNLGKNKIY